MGPVPRALSILALLAIGLIVFLNWGKGGSTTPVTVPVVTGKTKTDAEAQLKAMGLRWTETTASNSIAKDIVISQNPQANSQAHKNDVVQLTISLGPAPITLDDYSNKSEASARSALTGLGLKVQTTQTFSDTVQTGNVISQQPAAGANVQKGDTVTLTISSGAQKIEVPNLIGFTVSTASQTLSNAGLRTSFADGTDPSDLVTSTDPAAGTDVDKGTTVVLSTSSSDTTSSTTSTTTKKNNNGSGNGGGSNNN